MILGWLNLSVAEIIILLILGGLCFGGVVVAIVVLNVLVTHRQRPNSTSDSQAALEEENQRLREELTRLKKNQQG
jgi:hypothetical protein